ncbi:dipeptidase PepE [Aquimarina sp. ERC-38]|uniref:dipeptidase PepE n=1 Tax=Aquimarina sp. ERC-38 TaxID=2949996 RepID=UPI002247C5C1|nr:dipeptidase PepE [Aquimarina sp. ERC-38]UZO80800.1 dipeptidase PepE [Aquimarina sp. ERC-38]
MANCIIASTSSLFGQQPLAYFKDTIQELYKGCRKVLFIPYARPGGRTHDQYTALVVPIFKELGITLVGIHTFENAVQAIQNTEAFYTGGGNTFMLVHQLYQNQLITKLKEEILKGKPYLGTSAGSNICGLTMQTTNDMPIVQPQSFKTLGILPFNINPHYLDPNPDSTHNGETRETRIKEYHAFNTPPVIGLREGSWIKIKDEKITLQGKLTARIFEQNKTPYEITPETDVSFLK